MRSGASESYDAYRALPGEDQPVKAQKSQARLHTLATSRDRNTYRVIHSRSAGR